MKNGPPPSVSEAISRVRLWDAKREIVVEKKRGKRVAERPQNPASLRRDGKANVEARRVAMGNVPSKEHVAAKKTHAVQGNVAS